MERSLCRMAPKMPQLEAAPTTTSPALKEKREMKIVTKRMTTTKTTTTTTKTKIVCEQSTATISPRSVARRARYLEERKLVVPLPDSSDITLVHVMEPLIVGSSSKHVKVWDVQFKLLNTIDVPADDKVTCLYVQSITVGSADGVLQWRHIVFMGLGSGRTMYWCHDQPSVAFLDDANKHDSAVVAITCPWGEVWIASTKGAIHAWSLYTFAFSHAKSRIHDGLLRMVAVVETGEVYTTSSSGHNLLWRSTDREPYKEDTTETPIRYLTTRDGMFWRNGQVFEDTVQEQKGMLKLLTKGFILYRGVGSTVKVSDVRNRDFVGSAFVGTKWLQFDILHKHDGVFIVASDKSCIRVIPVVRK